MNGDDWPNEWEGLRTTDEKTRHRLDELLSLLTEQRRRDVLYYLAATEVTDIESLAQNVAAMNEGVSVEEVSNEVQEQVQLKLVHTDLPKLANADVIEFDSRSEAIRCRNLPQVLECLVDKCHDIEVE